MLIFMKGCFYVTNSRHNIYLEKINKDIFFLRFEKYVQDGECRYATAGYMTVYNYYAYPEKIRPRIR